MKEHMINKTKQEFKTRIKKYIYTHQQLKTAYQDLNKNNNKKANLKATEFQ